MTGQPQPIATQRPRSDAPRYGGTLHVAVSTDPRQFNPAIPAALSATHQVTGSIYNALVQLGEHLEPHPDLAESWEISHDGRSYVFHLARNVEWHDGTPFSSDDVRFTFEEVLFRHHRSTRRLSSLIERLETPDSATFEVHFREPYAALLARLDVHEAPIMPRHVYTGSNLETNGEAYPDYILLLCEAQADSGGESFVVDCQRLVDALATEPATRDLARFLWTVPVDNSPPNRPPMRLPVVSRTAGGRVTIRRHDQQRLPDDQPADASSSELLARWFDVTDRAVAAAPRFRMHAGDVLIMDNYRVLHGREAFEGGDRRLHRVWAWTEAAFGLPDVAGVDADLLRRSQLTAEGRRVLAPAGDTPQPGSRP